MVFLAAWLLAIITACLPLIISRLKRIFPALKLQPAKAWLPAIAGLFMAISVCLPDIHISAETTTFQQHFVGGGMYAACLYLYAKQLFGRPRLHWIIDILALFAWVSAFGVANKLGEFFLLKVGFVHLTTSDAYWDLLANTLGGFAGYLLFFWNLGKPVSSE